VTTCRNCDHTIPDYAECPYCALAHDELLERLQDRDGTATIAEVSGWVCFGVSEPCRPAWRIA